MGMTKSLLDDQESLRGMAAGLALEADAIRVCQVHEDITVEGDGDYEAVIETAKARLDAGDIDLPSSSTFGELAEAIEAVVMAADTCYICDKNANRD